ncbi:MAG TPA: ABC transporter ATP-binding protein [Anaerolineales bacterium]|nr:ABC transporter ATP-binding protein [Anaerolineales bacterium]
MSTPARPFDFQQTLVPNRLLGLWRMMSGYRWHYLGATASLAVSATAKTTTYLLLSYFIDTVLGEGQYLIPGNLRSTLVLVALGFLGLAAIEGTFSFLSGRLASYTAENITRRLRNYLFDHIQRLYFRYHKKTPTGDLIERCTSDVDALRRFFSDQAIGMGRVILLFTINFAAIFKLSWKLALLSIVAMPIIILTSAWFFKRLTKVYEAYQEQEAILSTTLQENLTGVRVVKAFARQEYERKKFEKDNWEKFVRGRRLTRMHSLFWPISDIVCGFQLLGGFLAAALMAINGEITVGTYMAYSGLVGWLIWPMRNLGRLIVQTSTGLVSFGRVREIIKQPREALTVGRYQPEKPVQGEIVFDQVGFSYEDDNELILQDISFTCQPGQVVALLGSTGSGKTSLINLLPRFYDYTSGSIKLDGVELKDYAPEFLRSQIGTVEQEPFLFSRTIGENIAYGVGRDVPHTEIEQAAQMAAVHDVILTFPQGYETMVGEKGVTLSGGQKQRVTIARTLLKDPRILILDDSTSSVDTETEAFIRDALRCLNVGRTTFIIAHRIQSVMNADLIVVLDKGRIVQKGTHAELLAQEGMYRQIYDLQTRIDEEVEKEVAGAAAR